MTESQNNILFLVALVLATLTYAKFVLKISATDIIEIFLKEFKSLLKMNLSPLSINAACIIVSLILVMIIAVSSSVKSLIYGVLSPGSSEPVYASPIFLLFFVLLFALFCFRAVKD
jgi:hypothetical protein